MGRLNIYIVILNMNEINEISNLLIINTYNIGSNSIQSFYHYKIKLTENRSETNFLIKLDDQDCFNSSFKELDHAIFEMIITLNKKVEHKLAINQLKIFPSQQSKIQFIKYKPTKFSFSYNIRPDHRIIQMHEMSSDPLEPPKHKVIKKIFIKLKTLNFYLN